MAIQWNKPIEAVHVDGTVMAVEVAANTHDPDDRQPIKVWPAPSDLAFWFALDGSHPEQPWRIRNVVPSMNTYTVGPEDEAALLASDPLSRSTSDERAVDPVLYERMVEHLKDCGQAHNIRPRDPDAQRRYDEMKAILAALEPVDPMLIEARQVVADLYTGGNVSHLREQALSGEGDEWFHTKVARAALARGRHSDSARC